MSSDITTVCKETAGKTLSLESAHNFVNHEAAEVADSSRVLVTPPEDLSLVLSTHTKRLTPAYNSTSRDLLSSYGFCRHCTHMTYTPTDKHRHTHKNKNQSSNIWNHPKMANEGVGLVLSWSAPLPGVCGPTWEPRSIYYVYKGWVITGLWLWIY